MSAKDWENYLWNLLPRPYKALGEDAETEARKAVRADAEEYARLQKSIIGVRENWLVDLMPSELLNAAGYERGKMFRWPKETDEEYRLRLHNAFLWYAMGGTPGGLKVILEALGYRDVKITERVTEEQWAEFGVEVTLPTGDLLVQDQIDRVVRIINEVKAAHTKLVSTNVSYDPPDIGLDPDHVHRYDYCYYDLGMWPLPHTHWGTAELGRVLTHFGLERKRFGRILISLAPAYDDAQYDSVHFGKWFRRHDRVLRGHTVRGRKFFYRTWNDPGTWEDPQGMTWYDRYFKDIEEPNLGKVTTIPRSSAVWGWSTYGSLNAAYDGGYARMSGDIGKYNEAVYGGAVDEAADVPVYVFRSRHIPCSAEPYSGGINSRYGRIRRSSSSVKANIAPSAGSVIKERKHFGTAEAYDGYDTWETRGFWTGTWNDRHKDRWTTRRIMVIREES